MIDCPFQFLDGDQNLTEASINSSLAAIEATRGNYFFLMIEDVSQQGLEYLSSFREGGLGPS